MGYEKLALSQRHHTDFSASGSLRGSSLTLARSDHLTNIFAEENEKAQQPEGEQEKDEKIRKCRLATRSLLRPLEYY